MLRSDSPHAFAAFGPQAGRITRPHPVDIPHGLESPPGRVYERGGQVLLLGVGHDAASNLDQARELGPTGRVVDAVEVVGHSPHPAMVADWATWACGLR